MLSKSDKPKKVTFNKTVKSIPTTSQQDINNRVLRIIEWGRDYIIIMIK